MRKIVVLYITVLTLFGNCNFYKAESIKFMNKARSQNTIDIGNKYWNVSQKYNALYIKCNDSNNSNMD